MENNIGKGEEEGEERLIPAASPLKPRHKLLTSGVPNQSARVRLGLHRDRCLGDALFGVGFYLPRHLDSRSQPSSVPDGRVTDVGGRQPDVRVGRTIGGAPRPTRDEWRETAIVGAFLRLGVTVSLCGPPNGSPRACWPCWLARLPFSWS